MCTQISEDKKPTKTIDHPKNNTVELKRKINQRKRLSTSHFINQFRSFECIENTFHIKLHLQLIVYVNNVCNYMLSLLPSISKLKLKTFCYLKDKV